MNDNQNPSADQPLVTHADRGTIELLALCAKEADLTTEERGRVDEFLKRTKDAAEADKPALPEGWVLLTDVGGEDGQRVLWHTEGLLYLRNDRVGLAGYVENHRDRITPLATATSIAPEGWHVDEDGVGNPTVWSADRDAIFARFEAPEAYDVLAALVTAAQAERGESR